VNVALYHGVQPILRVLETCGSSSALPSAKISAQMIKQHVGQKQAVPDLPTERMGEAEQHAQHEADPPPVVVVRDGNGQPEDERGHRVNRNRVPAAGRPRDEAMLAYVR